MNSAIAFFVGCLTFVLVMGIKIPIKKMIFSMVERMVIEEKRQYVMYKRWNTVLFLVVMLVAALAYYYVLRVMEIEHFKWCCSLKAGAVAIAIYAVYEQWFGDNDSCGKEE